MIRAKVFSDTYLQKVECRVDGGDWHPMNPVSGRSDLFEAGPSYLGSLVEVRVCTKDGREDADQVEPINAAWTAPSRVADGSDKDSVGAWPEKGILATQLGPNRKGRTW